MEEETELSIPNPNFTASNETIPNKKHLAMLERLSNRHQSLPNKPNSSFESTAAFLSQFAESKNSIDSELSQCRDTDSSNLKPQLDAISLSIADLEKLVAESSYYLPSYEVRSSLKTVSDLKQSLESLIPKKKFSFKSKPAKKAPISVIEPDPQSKPVKSDKSPSAPPSYALADSPGIRNRVGEVLVKDFRGSEIGEFSITDLRSCEVRLLGSARALFVHRLRDCKIFAGPVTGSILIEEAVNCLFVLASHQIRIHNATACEFYLRVRSRPIIEDCSGVRFAPYFLSYQGIEDDLRDSNLAEETGNWAMVDDFKWLKAVQSPNWSLLPEKERIEAVDISIGEIDSNC